MFPRVIYEEEHKLPNAIRKAGYDIKDIKAVIFGHLHIDHAGGLEHFLGTDIPSKFYQYESSENREAWLTGSSLRA